MDAPVKSQVEWKISDQPVAYPDALAALESRAAAIADGTAGEQVWLLEHPPIYTAGTSANDADLIEARFPVYRTGRGGQFTYHGPGQRVGYAMLDLKQRQPDVRAYVRDLEQWLIETLAQFNVKGERREGRVGIWVQRDGREDKIAALGVRIKRWVTQHGVTHALARPVIGELAAAPGAIDGKARLDQVAVLGTGAGGVDGRMLQQPDLLSRQSFGDGGGARLHLGQGLGIGDRLVADLPFHRTVNGGVQIKISETMLRQAGREFAQCKVWVHGVQCRRCQS